ncbi:MAG: insulinase family protein [Tannerellaceae bacterium]|nr:insulinase family protein [Tannerellaceae bacterium]
MKRILSFFLTSWLCLLCITFAYAQEELQPLPIDPKLRYGKLDNGLTYYIRQNSQTRERADFYIVQNVGSILEEENQRGLAHFLEHMAFDGTENFPGDAMDEYTESIGIRMGENMNAYTSFDETVYMIMNAPVTREGIIDSCLLILHDWSNFITLADSAIEKERGVIREEWRTRQDAQARLWEQQLPKMYPDSRYANRLPIGSIDVINNSSRTN